jgi:hypothetical protein
MNVRQIMSLVEEELRHSPNLGEWRNALRSKINSVNREFCGSTEHKWPWMVRRQELIVYPDLTLPLGGGGGVFKKGGWGDRTLDIPINLLRGVMYSVDSSDFWREHQTALGFGAEMELADRTLDPPTSAISHANWAYAPFAIELVVPSSGIAPSSANVTVQLDPRANIEAINGDEGDVAIRFRRRLLPADCSSLIAVRNEQGMKLRPLTPAQCAMSETDRNRIGTPCYVLEDGGMERVAITAYPGVHVGLANNHPVSNPFLQQRDTWPVRETIALANGPGGGSCLSSTRHRVILSWFWGGRYGSPSKPAEYTTGVGENTIRVSGYRLPPTSGANHEYGRRLSVWMAEAVAGSTTEFGAYMLKGFITATAATYDITESNANPADSRLRLPRWDEQFYDGLPKYIRIYPRPTAMARYEIEYRAFPRELIEDTDKLEIDGPHEVVAWKVAAELIGQRGGDPTRALALFEKAERRVKAKAGFSDRSGIRMGQVMGYPDIGDSRQLARHFIDPDSLDWEG